MARVTLAYKYKLRCVQWASITALTMLAACIVDAGPWMLFVLASSFVGVTGTGIYYYKHLCAEEDGL